MNEAGWELVRGFERSQVDKTRRVIVKAFGGAEQLAAEQAAEHAHRPAYTTLGAGSFENPAEHVDAIRDRSKEARKPFTIGELQAVMAVADPEWRSLIRFGLYTGQRLADLSLLTWENVDLARNEIRLVTKKTGKRLTIPMSAPLRQHVL